MDKNKLTNHIKDIDLKNKMFKVIDKVSSCIKNYDVKITEFLNPYEIKNAISILNSYDNINYHIDGGYDSAERKVIVIYPDYLVKENIDVKLSFIQINGNFKFKSVSHRDYLGSILGLGIKREKIGDILIHEDYCQVIIDKELEDFIIMGLTKVSRNNVNLKSINREELLPTNLDYKDIGTTISSNRLDSIISAIYNISRQESAKFINSEKVYVDYEKIMSLSKEIDNNSLISVRGKGRVIVEEVGGITKKGKLRLRAKIIL